MSVHRGSTVGLKIFIVDGVGNPQTGLTNVNVVVRSDEGADVGEYWTGINWSSTPTSLSLSEIFAGLYMYDLDTGHANFGTPRSCTAYFYHGSTYLGVLDLDFESGEDYYMSSKVDDILVDTSEMQGKLPTNNIMGSNDKTPYNDDIIEINNRVLQLIHSTCYVEGIVSGTPTATTFDTNITGYGDDFFNDMQVVFQTGTNNAFIARRISDYVSATGTFTVDTPFPNTPAATEWIMIISRFTSAGSGLTPSQIASAVWNEVLPGLYTGSEAGKVLADALAKALDIEIDTQNIQGRLPTTLIGGLMRSHIQAKDSTLPLSAQEKLDVNHEADQALIDYDPPTKAELDTAEANIIAEINVNEGKIDNIQTDINTILARIGLPPVTLWDSLKAEIDANEALIITLTGNLATHDTDIKSIIGTPIIDLMTDMNNRFDLVDAQLLANYNAIIQIQNNITTVFIVPERLVRPDTGSKPYKFVVLNYDSVGNMEDFDADPSIKGDYVSGGVYFASTTMTKIGTGHYEHTINVAYDDTLGAVAVQVDAVEGGNPRVLIRVTEVTDYDDELAEIKADTGAIYIKVQAGTPSPTIPEQLTSMEGHLTSEIDENQAIVETVRDDVEGVVSWANPGFIKSGYSIIDSENSILTGATELPLVPGTGETFSSDGGIIIIDKDGPNEEQIYYSGIVDDVITMSPTSKDHDPAESVYEVTRMIFHIALRRKDGQPNIQADSLPSFSIVHDLVGVEKTSTMAWEAAEGRYIGYIDYTLDVVAGKRSGTIGVEVDGQTRDYPFDFELCLRPASEKQINEAIGGAIPPNTFVFDHDGWIDEFGIKHEWTDEMAGSIKDDAGQPLICRIKAYLYDPVDVNVPILGPNPPYDNFTNQFGHYVGGLQSGKYLFTFIANGKKWKQVDRYIDYP